MYSEVYVPGMVLTESFVKQIFEKEVLSICKAKSFMGIWQLFSLSSVLALPIYSVYPKLGNPNVRADLNRMIYPRQTSVSRDCIYILWTSTRYDMLDKNWMPNHFVPVLPIYSIDHDAASDIEEGNERTGTNEMEQGGKAEQVQIGKMEAKRQGGVVDRDQEGQGEAVEREVMGQEGQGRAVEMDREGQEGAMERGVMDQEGQGRAMERGVMDQEGQGRAMEMDQEGQGGAVEMEQEGQGGAVERGMMDQEGQGRVMEMDQEGQGGAVDRGMMDQEGQGRAMEMDQEWQEGANESGVMDQEGAVEMDREGQEGAVEMDQKVQGGVVERGVMDQEGQGGAVDRGVMDQEGQGGAMERGVMEVETQITSKENINLSGEIDTTLLLGKFVAVKYDNRPYPGKVIDVDVGEIQVMCMLQVGRKMKNCFFWPKKVQDICWYEIQNVISVIPPPNEIQSKESGQYMIDEHVWNDIIKKL